MSGYLKSERFFVIIISALKARSAMACSASSRSFVGKVRACLTVAVPVTPSSHPATDHCHQIHAARICQPIFAKSARV